MSATHQSSEQKTGADYSAPPLGSRFLNLTVPAGLAGCRLDQVLARLLPEHSRNRLQGWVRDGRVRVDGAAAEPKRKLWGGETLQVEPDASPADLAQAPEPIPLAVIYEDEQILILDKPAGLVVHPGSGNWRGTLLNALLHRLPALAGLPRAGIVHRLDKDTSGLLVVAKTLEAQTDLVRQLHARTVKREYLALVRGAVNAEGLVDAPVGRHPVHRTRMAVIAGGRPARTHYRVRERLPGATLVECALESGRTHQIRVHMAHIGHPIIGDPVYARHPAGGIAFARQALHAWRLGLRHPASGAAMHWESALPDDLAELLARLRGEAPARA
jgi:23S rRNA pseudouridine1911/1915/1917 synthase